ncbi:hypothetical protein GH5_01251 [Leishmania sp. Ghana 2012 LV757]|uniref:hypothetical protein n=1 Tax=Leishmania sp. Ghana 2012 LV757 TaxID=2803181 RepID=UPI001B420392|nr:hypothetical protein GH5_01251 [Leishmania sp. Ghana 2012 LV757]
MSLATSAMSESVTSGIGTVQRNSSRLLPPSNDPSLRRSGSSPSASEGYRDRDKHGRAAMVPPVNPAPFYARESSRASYPAAEPSRLSPAADASVYAYPMDAPKNPLDNSGASLDFAGLEDSQKHSYHPIKFMGCSSGAGSPKSADFVHHQSVSTHPTRTDAASATPALGAKSALAAPPEHTLAQSIVHTATPFGPVSGAGAVLADGSSLSLFSASKSPAFFCDSLNSLHALGVPVPLQQLTETRAQSSTRVSQIDAAAAVPPIVVRDANPSRLTASALDFPRLPTQPQPPSETLSHSIRQIHKLSTPFSDTPQGVSRLPLAPAPQSLTSLGSGSRRSSEGDVLGLRSNKPQVVPLARKTRNTPLALLESSSSSNGDSGGGKKRGGDSPARPAFSSSTSSSRGRSDEAYETSDPQALPPLVPQAPPQGQPSSLPPPPPTPVASFPTLSTPSSSPLATTSGLRGAPLQVSFSALDLIPALLQLQQWEQPAAAGFVHFSPIIQQFDFHKTDIKNIACTSVFTLGDVSTLAVRLRLLPHEVLGRAEPIANIQQAAMRAGRVKVWKPKTSDKKRALTPGVAPPGAAPEPPRVVEVADFHDTLAVFDNALLAISFALWSSVAPYNDLVRALLAFCAPDLRLRSGGKTKRNDENGGAAVADKPQADAVATAAASASTQEAPKRRIRVPFSSVLRFLNHCGVDVLVMSSDRKCASSFCAKRRHVFAGGRRPSAGFAYATQTASELGGGGAGETAAAAASLRRVLVALSYDQKEALWCPLTTSRPLRHVASQWSDYRRSQRRQTRRDARREKRKAEAEAAAQAKRDAIKTQLLAWQQRIAPNGQGPQQSEAGAKDAAAASFRSIATATDGVPHVIIDVPGDSPSDGSKTPSLKSGDGLPFHKVLYPTLVQTNLSFTLLLRQGLHSLFAMVRVRLMVGVPLGCVVVLFGIALIVYVSKTTDVCLIDLSAGQCVDVGCSDSDSGCIALLTSFVPATYDAALSRRYLYGPPMAPGKCLIVTICCSFAALLDNVLIVFFAVRYLALGSIQPCFMHVLRGVQAVLGAIVCAFAAYVLSIFHRRLNVLPCSALVAGDAVLCEARLQRCGYRYAYGAHGPLKGANVALILTCVYLVLCVLHWVVAALPVLPSVVTQDLIPTATPDTYAFHPSLFAPDGPMPPEVDQLRHAMQPPLRQELRHHSRARDRLLTTMTTIGEMMQANHVNSLKQTKLNEERRQQRARPFQKHSHGDGDERRGPKDRRGGYPRYVVVGAEGQSTSRRRSSSLRSTDAGAGQSRGSVVLAPRLVKRVAEIGCRLQERTIPITEVNSFDSAKDSLSAMPGEEQVESSPTSKRSRRLVCASLSSFPCTSTPRARVVDITDDECIIPHSSDDELARGRAALPLTSTTVVPTHAAAAAADAAPPLPVPLSSRPLTSADFVTFPNCTPAVAATSGERRRHSSGSHFSRLTSVRPAGNAGAVSSAVDAEIDEIVARLRARRSAAPDGAL